MSFPHGCFLLLCTLVHQSISIRTAVDIPGLEARQGNILYIVRTSEPNKKTRLPSILETWAAPLHKDSLLIVGINGSENPKVYGATGCADDHDAGLDCKTGHAFGLAANMIGSHDWAFVVDDDLYVNTANLESVLQKHDPSKPKALGIVGCGADTCRKEGNFCGGGGYAMSRTSLKALVDNPEPSQFRKKFADMSAELGVTYDDVIATCMLSRIGVDIEQMEGLYGWKLEDKHAKKSTENLKHAAGLNQQYKHAIHTTSPLPLTFHYVTPEQMYLIHQEFAKHEPESALLLELEGATSFDSYAEQLQKHLSEQKRLRV